MNQELDACYHLWRECFGDSKEYTDFYFREKTKYNRILVKYEENILASMLHLNPYEVCVFHKRFLLHYIVGVSTLPEFRNQGKMRSLLCEAFDAMYHNNEPFTYLSPASEAIYRPFGFDDLYIQERVTAKLMPEGLSSGHEIICEKFSMLKPETQEQTVTFANQALSGKVDIYVRRTVTYFEMWAEEMKSAGGDLLVFVRDNKVIGLIPYMYEDKRVEVIEVLTDQSENREVLRRFKVFLKKQMMIEKDCLIKFMDTFFIKDVLEMEFDILKIKEHLMLMARIIHFEKFVESMQLGKKFINDEYFEIHDDWIPANNGVFTWQKKEDSYICKRVSQSELPEEKITCFNIEEIQMKILESKRVYINDIV